MGSVVVVVGGEGVELGLEFVAGVGVGLAGEGFFEGLVEAFDFAAGGGVVGVELIWRTPRRCSSASSWLRPPLPPANRVVKTMPLSVRVEYGMPYLVRVLVNSLATICAVMRWWAVTESA